jgi:hypothetical protein
VLAAGQPATTAEWQEQLLSQLGGPK